MNRVRAFFVLCDGVMVVTVVLTFSLGNEFLMFGEGKGTTVTTITPSHQMRADALYRADSTGVDPFPGLERIPCALPGPLR
jgi:hypothetical protein